jgi:hypothetical protein
MPTGARVPALVPARVPALVPARVPARVPTLVPAVALLLGAALAAAGCGSTGATAAPGSPSAEPPAVSTPPAAPASLPADAIQHPTGPTDVVLRVDVRGGFVMQQVAMARLPLFTLYGDGRTLLVPADSAAVDPGGGIPAGPVPLAPLREVRLRETDVQAILAYALREGRLGIAREAYLGGNIDAPSTVFEVHAGGVDKSVRVTGLSADPAPGPDAADTIAFSRLLEQLRSVQTQADFVPSTFVALISETEGAEGAPVSWPWADLAPADFPQPGEDDPIPFPRHSLTAAQVAALGVDVGPGGLGGLHAMGPDGRTYVLAILPALPEAASAR